jgi:hypothetical protein
MDAGYLLAIVATTSGLLWLFGRRVLGLSARALPAAIGAAAELLGAAMLFWALNVALGAGIALAVRGLGLGFVSLYVNTDLSLGAFSLGQALVWEAWRRTPQART